MAFETRDGQGALFANDRKAKDSEPDYRGNVRVGGVLYRLSGWRRTGRSGKPWLSLAIQPDEAIAASVPSSARQSGRASAEHPFDGT